MSYSDRSVTNQAVPVVPQPRSLQDILEKDGNGSFDDSKHSLEVIGDAVRGDGVTIVQDSAYGTGTPDIVQIVSSGTANTFGAAVSIDASTASVVWLSHVSIQSIDDDATKGSQWVLELLVDATAKIRLSGNMDLSYEHTDTTDRFTCNRTITLPIPIRVAASSAITVKMADTTAAIITYNIGVSYYIGLE